MGLVVAFVLAICLSRAAAYPEAQCRIALCSERMPLVLGLLGRAYALDGQNDKARELQTELQAIAKRRYTSQVAHALVSMGLGELDSAMQWLQEAFQAHDAFLCYAKVFPPYDALRERPAFPGDATPHGCRRPFDECDRRYMTRDPRVKCAIDSWQRGALAPTRIRESPLCVVSCLSLCLAKKASSSGLNEASGRPAA